MIAAFNLPTIAVAVLRILADVEDVMLLFRFDSYPVTMRPDMTVKDLGDMLFLSEKVLTRRRSEKTICSTPLKPELEQAGASRSKPDQVRAS